MNDVKQIIVVRKLFPDADGNMRKIRIGKYCAQSSHSSMAWICHRIQDALGKKGELSKLLKLSPAELQWVRTNFKKVVVSVDSEEELLSIHAAAKKAGLESQLITDSGLTEFNGVPTKTALAIGPDEANKIDPITGHLPLF